MKGKVKRSNGAGQKRKTLREETRCEIRGLLLLALGALGFVGLYSGATGLMGQALSRGLKIGLGDMAPVALGLLVAWGLALIIFRTRACFSWQHVGLGILLILLAILRHGGYPHGGEIEAGVKGLGGGVIGGASRWVLVRAFGPKGIYVALVVLALVGSLLATGLTLRSLIPRGEIRARLGSWGLRTARCFWRTLAGVDKADIEKEVPRPREPQDIPLGPVIVRAEEIQDKPQEPPVRAQAPRTPKKPEEVPVEHLEATAIPVGNYRLPPLDILDKGRKKKRRSDRDLEERARLLESTLESFGVRVSVVGVSEGPAVTRFEVHPAPGVKVSQITRLSDDIALSLAATQVRVEAPIPGKPALGIEVPNSETSMVFLREVLESPEYQSAHSILAVGLGKDIAGRPLVAGLDKMLHLLIAGATGSGKSVCVNAIIASLLFRARPHELKMLLVDPKVVELSLYNGIPHLLAPVITDPKRAAACLKWVVSEMMRRYEMFGDSGVRDIAGYNHLCRERPSLGLHEIPYILVVIDELADLMMVAPVEVEDCIFRLAQMARAAGIHLVVATQRPSTDVITGTIKANMPSRVAFAVTSHVDSRTILDSQGAEKLLGMGDMLFSPVWASKPFRAQGAYISDEELEALVSFVKGQGSPVFHPDIARMERDEDIPIEQEDDKLFARALRVVVEQGQASVSLVQRRLRVGYTRAGRLIDAMEQRGFVGPHEGSKPREVRLTLDEYDRLFHGEPKD
jgi:S-DNA-T family DNA segregation ATPase FtsK/SpoIIIE